MIVIPIGSFSVKRGTYKEARNPTSIVITDMDVVCDNSSAVAANDAKRADTKQ
jgi:hypothetical protein